MFQHHAAPAHSLTRLVWSGRFGQVRHWCRELMICQAMTGLPLKETNFNLLDELI